MNRVGEGTYGVVYRARDTKSGEIVALKRVRMDREKDGMPVSGLRDDIAYHFLVSLPLLQYSVCVCVR